jgi:hypothetical protein
VVGTTATEDRDGDGAPVAMAASSLTRLPLLLLNDVEWAATSRGHPRSF